jgi:hypothetical protein
MKCPQCEFENRSQAKFCRSLFGAIDLLKWFCCTFKT